MLRQLHVQLNIKGFPNPIIIRILCSFKGWLCGECNKMCSENKKSGIGVLTTKCRCSGDAMYSYLVPLVGKC